jgi:hypothetical protein
VNWRQVAELGLGFVLGVVSSLVAEAMLLYFKGRSFVAAAARLIVRQNSLRRLASLRRRSGGGHDDPKTVVRAEWACALYDLGSAHDSAVDRALQALRAMADLLEPAERDVAREAVRLGLSSSQKRALDREYLTTMERLL